MSEIERCPTCGHIVSERKISLYKGMVASLANVYNYLVKNKKHEFTRKEVKHLFKNENDTARFGDWILFGGLLYKSPNSKRGMWGMNMERTFAFLKNQYQIPTTIWKNPVTKKIRPEDYATIKEIPDLKVFLDKDGLYTYEYGGAR